MSTTFCERRARRTRFPRRERGVVMFVAMIVLIVMTLAGLAMLRQMGSNSAIAGNMAFKQGATSNADWGIEMGRVWLTTTDPNQLIVDSATNAANGYHATWGTANDLDPTSVTWKPLWDAAAAKEQTDSVTQDRVRFVIQRLCAASGAPDAPGQTCTAAKGVPTDKGGPNGTPVPAPPSQPYYRITARVQGTRNTVSYTQVVLGAP